MWKILHNNCLLSTVSFGKILHMGLHPWWLFQFWNGYKYVDSPQQILPKDTMEHGQVTYLNVLHSQVHYFIQLKF